MADPTKPKKKRGPSVKKPKTAFMVYKGDVDLSSVKILFNAEEVMDAMDADSGLKRAKFVIPVKTKPRATEPNPAQ